MSDLFVQFGTICIEIINDTLEGVGFVSIDAHTDYLLNEDQCSHYLVDHQQRRNTTNLVQDGLNLGCEHIGVHLRVLFDTGIEPTRLFYVFKIPSQGIFPLPILECWSHQEPQSVR